MAERLLTTEQLSCERDDWPLFSGLDLTLAAGQALQVVGPNGSGKTTLLRALAGLHSPAHGEIHWRGRPVAQSRWEFRRDLLYIGHQPGIKAGLTPLENLHWYAGMGSATGAEAAGALARVGLAGCEETPCYRLSAGQLRRVALARLYCSRARLWLLDEPLTAIDRAGTEELLAHMENHCRWGGAVLLTSHQPLALAGLSRLDLAEYAPSESAGEGEPCPL